MSHLTPFQTGSDVGGGDDIGGTIPSDVLVNPTLQTELGSKEMISSIDLNHSFDQSGKL